jgi:hypothetical protein
MGAGPRPTIGYLAGGDHVTGGLHDEARVTSAGSTDLYELRDRALDEWRRLLIPRNYLRAAVKHNFDHFDVLLNLITDPDQHPETLAMLARLLRPYRGRLLNPPGTVLRTTREKVAQTLTGIAGLTVPQVAAFRGTPREAARAIDRIGFPAILRAAGTHSGQIVGVAPDAGWVTAHVRPADRYVLTRFVDTRDADGLYRKLRVFFFDGRPVIRHLLVSDHWSIHAADRGRYMASRPALIAEERRVVEGGVEALPAATRATLAAIAARLGLHLFGADLALRPDGTLVLFEANATMNFFPMSDDPAFAHLDIARVRAAEAFGRMLHPAGVPA